MPSTLPPPVRLAECLGALSLAADAANGFPPEKVLRTCLIAGAVARGARLPVEEVRLGWWFPLLRYLGCTGFAHEEGARYGAGDDIATRNTMVLADEARVFETIGRVAHGLAPGAPLLDRTAAVLRILGDGRSFVDHAAAQCEASAKLATIAGFPADWVLPLSQICERWDGLGQPHGLAGEAITTACRLLRLADGAEVAWHRGGRAAAVTLVRQRSGAQLDPRLCEVFLTRADTILSAVEGASVWERFLVDEPLPLAWVDEERLEGVALALACFADLKCTWTVGHSPGVARLAEKAGRLCGLDAPERHLLRLAALLHDLGRVAVPNSLWDKPGPLGQAERERVRQHTYVTERILAHSPLLAPVAALARAAHERVDGTGYHRGVPGALLPPAARILAAADVYHALREARPHRPAYDAGAAAALLVEEASAGRLDAEAVRAVLQAAGVPDEAPVPNPAGLSEREVEVLVAVARGRTSKEIAARLGISAKTVQHHIAHVYAKIGARSRAAAALYAVERGLLELR